MKRFTIIAAFALSFIIAPVLHAQEHYTEGYVREVSFYRTKPDHFEDYMKYLRANFLPQQEEAKKQGLIMGYSVLINVPSSPDDWDVAIITLHKNFGTALDYNQGDDAKMKAIAAKHFNTTDEKKQQEVTGKRLDLREFRGTRFYREVALKPLQ
jgi:hypothetical protein